MYTHLWESCRTWEKQRLGGQPSEEKLNLRKLSPPTPQLNAFCETDPGDPLFSWAKYHSKKCLPRTSLRRIQLEKVIFSPGWLMSFDPQPILFHRIWDQLRKRFLADISLVHFYNSYSISRWSKAWTQNKLSTRDRMGWGGLRRDGRKYFWKEYDVWFYKQWFFILNFIFLCIAIHTG